MDVSHILEQLNPAQREAVAAPPGPLLVLAGAGSGKTRVLTYRVAWLVQALGVSPLAILAVTFTNKASREMRGRIEDMLGFSVGGMWMGTFHGMAHRFLRAHHDAAALPKTFEILDSDDQLRIVKRVLRDMNLDEAYWNPKQVQWFINGHKEEGRRAKDLGGPLDSQNDQLIQIYLTYEQTCQRGGLVDFAELLLRAYEVTRDDDAIRQRYQRRFQHVLVDEFQDTNAIQYAWLKLLVDDANSLFVVGDDDQSIYGWRGARVENILSFDKDYPATKVIRLEQNYRSSKNILSAANGVIAHNQGRLGKDLWTEIDDGEPVRLYAAFNDIDEARFVVDRIQDWVDGDNKRSQAAILYRSNAQSRVFEEILLDIGMPYRVYGGLRFFERAEVKDALAYLRLVGSRDSDPAFERVVNTPPRGIGAKTVARVRERARASNLSLWEATRTLLAEQSLASRAHHSLAGFLRLIDDLAASVDKDDLTVMTEQVIRGSGLIEHFGKDKTERGEARLENLEELVNATRQFRHDETDELSALDAFLAGAALEAGEGQAEAWEDCVQLMSLHSAKGLEFSLVFLVGLEEGLFPHSRSSEEPGRLEEERRLCYVGMTRAKSVLYLSYAEVRRLHGRENYTAPSRFLRELPPGSLTEVRSTTTPYALATAASVVPASVDDGFGGVTLGGRVHHASFGDGTVMNLEGTGEYARVHVNFESAGSKWLILAYANLTPL